MRTTISHDDWPKIKKTGIYVAIWPLPSPAGHDQWTTYQGHGLWLRLPGWEMALA